MRTKLKYALIVHLHFLEKYVFLTDILKSKNKNVLKYTIFSLRKLYTYTYLYLNIYLYNFQKNLRTWYQFYQKAFKTLIWRTIWLISTKIFRISFQNVDNCFGCKRILWRAEWPCQNWTHLRNLRGSFILQRFSVCFSLQSSQAQQLDNKPMWTSKHLWFLSSHAQSFCWYVRTRHCKS